ncbi:bZIP transcription factor [Sporobolomyces salmoneus]|uniref:bZIP transcription factor n=1 Tax=Sporobolomyces salmoneus TaxID=183962 RepID=UPI00316EDF63
MSGLDWQAPEFLSNPSSSGDDYLASLSSFLDGQDSKYPPNLSLYGSSLSSGLGGASSLPPLSHNSANASSPELTSDSGASPASSDGVNNHGSNQQSTSSTRSGNVLETTTTARAVTHDKRKGGPQTTQAIKDRRSGNSARSSLNGHHSHPDGVEGEIKRSASPEEEDDGGGGKKSSGGKKTSEKRKAQNRAAQRNFRERKEKHLKELEDKVGVLEQKSNDQEAENSALKQLLQQLKSENDRLKVFESAFSFSYDKDVNNSSTMPTSSTFESRPPLPATHSSSSNNSNHSPDNSFSFDNSSFELPAPHSTDLYPPSTTSSAFPGFPITSSAPTTSAGGGPGAFPDNLFLNSLTVPPTSTSFTSSADSPISPGTNASTSSTRSSSYLATPPHSVSSSLPPLNATQTDLFASYRDPLADLSLPSAPLSTFNDFDQLFASTSGSTALEDSMAQFIKSPSPLPSDDSLFNVGTNGHVNYSKEDIREKDGKKMVTVTGGPDCPYGLVQGEKYEFDLDNLCSEMKLKATCQEAARQALASAMAEDAKISASAYPQQL